MHRELDFDEIVTDSPLLSWQRKWLVELAARSGDRSARAIAAIVSMIDGRRTKADVLELGLRTLGDIEALAALERLEAGGYLHAPGATARSEVSAREAPSPPVVDVYLVRSDASAPVDQVVQRLQDAGLPARWVADAERDTQTASALDLYVCSDPLAPELEAINREHIRTRREWCLVVPDASAPLVGPVFNRDQGPCWACLAYWLSNQRPAREFDRVTQAPAELVPHAKWGEVIPCLVLGVVGAALADLGVDHSHQNPLLSNVLALNWLTLLLEPCPVRRRPQCEACGDPTLMRRQGKAPLRLRDLTKRQPHQGGYRQHVAINTFEHHRSLINARTGAVTFVEPMPNRYSPLRPVYLSAYPKVSREGPAGSVEHSLAFCAGKGRSDAQARASALFEALERASGVYRGDEASVRGSVQSLEGRAFAPDVLTGFSARQYAERRVRNAAHPDRSQHIPEPLPKDVEIDWTYAWSLSGKEHRCVPLSYCFSGCPQESGVAYCSPNGNGVASGTCLEEAVLQALLELVERDAVAVWWYNRLRRPSLDLAKSSDSYVSALLDDAARSGRDLWVLDLTHDLGIPVCAAISCDRERRTHEYSIGFGCHLNADIAIERALTELNQMGDGRNPYTNKPFVDTRLLDDPSYLTPSERSQVDPRTMLRFDGAHLAADIEECMRRLSLQGLEVLVVDKSRPELEVAVAQVIVPGLRHFWPRFAPGRLYEVPVRLGWRAAPTPEMNLNSLPLAL